MTDISSLEDQITLLEEKNRDLTARIKTLSIENRAQAALLEVLLEKVPFGIIMFNDERVITQMNKSAEAILNLNRVSHIGRTCDHLFECYTKHGACPLLNHEEILDRVETTCPGEKRKNITVLRSAECANVGEEKIIIEAFFDISEIKKAREVATSLMQAKDSFLSMISHELRTPLNAVIGFSQILKKKVKQADSVKLLEYINDIESAGFELLHIVDEVLDYSRLAAGKIQIKKGRIRMKDLLSQIETMSEPLALKNNNEFTVSCENAIGDVNIDAQRTRQVLNNLLSNAFKFTTHGRVRLDVRKKDDEYNTIEFIVTDTGIGMTEEQLVRIFKEFEQADNSLSRKYGGTGLGLSIAKSLTELMGGTISATSEEGVGSSFVLSLPAG